MTAKTLPRPWQEGSRAAGLASDGTALRPECRRLIRRWETCPRILQIRRKFDHIKPKHRKTEPIL